MIIPAEPVLRQLPQLNAMDATDEQTAKRLCWKVSAFSSKQSCCDVARSTVRERMRLPTAGTGKRTARDQLFGSGRSYVFTDSSFARSFVPAPHGRKVRNECVPNTGVCRRSFARSLAHRTQPLCKLALSPQLHDGGSKKRKKNAEGCCKLGSLAVRGGRESSLSNSVNKTGYFIQIQVGPCKCEAAQPRQVM